jgi:hypothetical protein
VRKALFAERPQVRFLLVALVLTYPSVWLAADARGRYYMPLYPCLALLMGLVVEHCTARSTSSGDRRDWRWFLRGASVAVGVGALVIVAASLLPIERLSAARQPWPFLTGWTVAAVVAAGVLMWASLGEHVPRPQIAIITLAGFVSLSYVGAVINSRSNGANDLNPAIARLKLQLPDPAKLVSLGRVYHRFTYCYETPIRQVPWPLAAAELPPEVTYFCFDRRQGDNDRIRSAGDDRFLTTTSGTLPFEWETVAEIRCDPVRRDQHVRTVVIGRVCRTQSIDEH